VCLGTFLLLVDVTIVVVALPALADDLDSDFASLQWVLDGYALALAALLLGAGSLADRFGRRRTYLTGLVLFGVSSLACALSLNASMLIAARVVQGIGGAAMFATTAAILNVTYEGRDRGVAFGIWGAVNGAAAAAGPIVGGLLTEHLDWRWIFLVNLPVCAAAAWYSVRGLAESKAPYKARFDLPGTVTFTLAAAALVFGLIRASSDGWTDGWTLASFVVGVLATVAFLVAERVSTHPMLDLSLFRSSSFRALILASLLAQAAAFAYLPYTTVWLQQILGHGPVDAGLLGALPMSAAALVVGALAGGPLQRVAPRVTVGVGLLLIGGGAALQGQLDARDGGSALIAGLILAGLGVGAVLPNLASAVLAAVPRERSGMASGALNTFRQLGFALGVAVFGVLFQHRVDAHGRDVRAGFADGLNATLWLAAALAVVAAVFVLVSVRGGAAGGHRTPHPSAASEHRQTSSR
jgi:EmrB/QacA subfamily drug resistance transporter